MIKVFGTHRPCRRVVLIAIKRASRECRGGGSKKLAGSHWCCMPSQRQQKQRGGGGGGVGSGDGGGGPPKSTCWMDGPDCRLISDACVSMRVCFDSLCFSAPQTRLADDEEEQQQQQHHHNQQQLRQQQLQQQPSRGLNGASAAAVGDMAELQEMLRLRDERIAELENTMREKDSIIDSLRSQLDKFQTVMSFSALTPTNERPKTQRVGISAEPTTRQELLTPLNQIEKSDRLVFTYLDTIFLYYYFRAYRECMCSANHVFASIAPLTYLLLSPVDAPASQKKERPTCRS